MTEGVIIFTDGSSRGNPGPGGYGAIVALPDEVVELGGREDDTTNNRMELTAALTALSFLLSHKSRPAKISVYSDSSYVINGITKWVHGWKKNGWQTKGEDDVLNRDLWEELDAVSTKIKPAWHYVAGHAGHSGNERCDEIATSFADGAPGVLYRGPRAGYKVSLVAPVGGLGAPRSKSRSGAAYSYVSAVGGVVQTHQTWAECESRVKGAAGARYRKAFSPEDERALIREFSK